MAHSESARAPVQRRREGMDIKESPPGKRERQLARKCFRAPIHFRCHPNVGRIGNRGTGAKERVLLQIFCDVWKSIFYGLFGVLRLSIPLNPLMDVTAQRNRRGGAKPFQISTLPAQTASRPDWPRPCSLQSRHGPIPPLHSCTRLPGGGHHSHHSEPPPPDPQPSVQPHLHRRSGPCQPPPQSRRRGLCMSQRPLPLTGPGG